jgi:RNA polymerase sigma-70 factor (ECF subfamily)
MSPLLARRQERAFERLYRRHVADVYRYALVVLRDADVAESATQATFVRALRAHERGERPRKAFNWLLGIAHDVCERPSPGWNEPLDAWDDETAPRPGDIRRALDQLGLDERAVLMMREIECRSYAEIAELLGLADGEVEALVFRARQALRTQLEKSLTCHHAERAISLRLDGMLPRRERKLLRGHLRYCPDCVAFERMQHQSRAALRSFATAPVPESLRFSR